MEGKDRARIAIYSIGGIYLLIVAYNMFHNLDTIVGNGEYILSIVFIVIFAIAGAGMASLGIWDVYRNYKKLKDEYSKTSDVNDVEMIENETIKEENITEMESEIKDNNL